MAVNFGNWQAEINKIWNNITPDLLTDFQDLRAFSDKISFIEENEYIQHIPWLSVYFENCKRYHRKSAEKASDHRQKGNKYFQKKLYSRAIEEYTQALMYAPLSDRCDTELSLAFGNRSAALYHVEKYKECISDIEQAMESGYPENILHKLYLRRGHCLFNMEYPLTAEKDFKKARELIETKEDMNLKMKETIMKEITGMLKKIENFRHSREEKLPVCGDVSQREKLPVVSYGKNPVITQASSAVKMEYTDLQGRFIVATENIAAGDTLFVERPFAAVLLPDNYMYHCHHCYGWLHKSVPCHNCCLVLYCSCQCRDESWIVYHNVECCYLDLLHSVGIAHLSLRVVLTAGYKDLLDFRESLKTRPSETKKNNGGLTAEGKYENNYLAVYDLLTHSQDMPIEDLFQYTLTAVLLLHILQHSGWFDQITRDEHDDSSHETETNQSENLSEAVEQLQIRHTKNNDEIYIGTLLLRHILQLVCNAHAITELKISEVDDHSLVESKSHERIATAIYPTASLMNHSCDPNIISSFQKNILVVKAVRDIPKGEEVFNCYGPHCKRMSRPERQQVLHDQYFFTCVCEACQKQDSDHELFNTFRCTKCEGNLFSKKDKWTCTACNEKVNGVDFITKEMEGKDLFVDGLQCLQRNNIHEAIKCLRKCYNLRKHILYKYHKDLAETQDCLARCYAMINDFKSAKSYLQESIETVEATYGKTSIELANELQKFAEVLVNAKEINEALLVIDKAVTVFKIHYNERHNTIEELQQLKTYLLQFK